MLTLQFVGVRPNCKLRRTHARPVVKKKIAKVNTNHSTIPREKDMRSWRTEGKRCNLYSTHNLSGEMPTISISTHHASHITSSFATLIAPQQITHGQPQHVGREKVERTTHGNVTPHLSSHFKALPLVLSSPQHPHSIKS